MAELSNIEACQPIVSVFMSVYNGWPHIKEAVESTLNQSYKNYEYVIVDDGSTDECSAYLDAIEDQRVRIIHQENKGLGKPLNRWMRECRGKYIMRMDADDINIVDRIEKQVAYLEGNPSVILVGCQIGYISNLGETSRGQSDFSIDHYSIIEGLKRGWSTMSHPAIMFRRALLEKIDGYVITGAGEDYSLIMDAARFGELSNLDEILYKMRIHDGSTSWENSLKTLAGFEYARRRFEAAENGIDYSLSQFQADWAAKGALARLQLRGKALAMVVYRKAKIDRIKGNSVRAMLRTSLAAILDLNSTVGWILKNIRSNRSGKSSRDA